MPFLISLLRSLRLCMRELFRRVPDKLCHLISFNRRKLSRRGSAFSSSLWAPRVARRHTQVRSLDISSMDYRREYHSTFHRMFAELTSSAGHNECSVCSAVRYATRSVLNVQGERFPQGQPSLWTSSRILARRHLATNIVLRRWFLRWEGKLCSAMQVGLLN